MHIMIETNTTDCHNLDKNPTEGTCFEKLYYSHIFLLEKWNGIACMYRHIHMDVGTCNYNIILMIMPVLHFSKE